MNLIIGIILPILSIIFVIMAVNNLKKNKSSAYLFAYLFIWILFGGIYWTLATVNNNASFILQEDIRIKSISQTIYDKLQHNYCIEDINNIISTNSYKLHCMNIADNDTNTFFVIVRLD